MVPAEIIQLTPEYPPLIGGVASYAAHLKEEFERIGIANTILSYKGNVENAETVYYANGNTDRFEKYVDEILAVAVNTGVILHYVSYGYNKNGLPFFLLTLVEKITKRFPVIIIYHELGASGSLLTKAGWTGFLQKYIAKKLARKSTGVITTTAWYKEYLDRWSRGTYPVKHVPVFSNMGIAEVRVPMAQRKNQLVIFGTAASKKILYADYLIALKTLAQQYNIEHIYDLGTPVKEFDYEGNGITTKGIRTEEEISDYLKHSRLGVLSYDLRVLDKSGILAAYQSQGLPTYIFTDNYIERLPERLLWYRNKEVLNEGQLEQLSNGMFEYYSTYRSLKILRTRISELFKSYES